MQTTDRITHLLERLARLLVSDGHHQGLKPVQWEALRYLGRANRFSRTPTGLTSYLGSTKGTVSQTLMTLQRKGWVQKMQDANDKRSVRLELTEDGKRILEEDPLSHMAAAITLAGVTDPDRLAEDLKRVLRRRLVTSGGKTFGLCRTCHHFSRATESGEAHHCLLLDVPLSKDDSERICVEHQI